MYLHQRNNWWEFSFDKEAVMNKLGPVRAKQGLMLGRMSSLGFDFQDEAMLTTMSLELVRSCEIEGEVLNLTEVRSSIARRLGINTAGLVPASRYVEGIVEMLLDATQHYDQPLSDDRLFGWHQAGGIDAEASGDGRTDFREVEDFALYLAGTDEFQGHGGEHGFVLEVETERLHPAQHEALFGPDRSEFVHHGLFVEAEFPPVISLMQVHSRTLFVCKSTVNSANKQDIHR